MNPRIKELLARPSLERLNDWVSIGPVQRAALEEFAELVAAQEREWQGLTLKDIDDLAVSMFSMDWMAGARWAEAKLREKNT